MSVLGDAVKARVNAEKLIQWTNPENRGATVINDTQLENAVTAASLDFLSLAEQEFDETNARHIEYGVIGTIAYLKQWGGGGADDGESDYTRFEGRLEKLKNTTVRARVVPQSKSPIRRQSDLKPNDPGLADDPRWGGVQPNPPRTGTRSRRVND